MGRLDGKVAFITGMARGQGRSHAVRLAEDGAHIVGVDIAGGFESTHYPAATLDDLAQTVKMVEAEGVQVLAEQADVRDQAALDAVVARALDRFGHIDIVVANAGIGAHAPTWELSETRWQEVIDVNLTGVWKTVKACIPSMIAAGRGGSIVLTSSLAGLRSYANIANYVAAKHGVNGLMGTLTVELGPHNIRVNTVCPGLVNTPLMMNDETFALFRPELEHPTQDDAAQVFRTMQILPVDWLEPRDISNAVAFLVSDEARYITGVALPIDGGQLRR